MGKILAQTIFKVALVAALGLGVPATRSMAQTLYVDPAKGKDEARGTIGDPFSSIERAVTVAGGFTGAEPITIKLAPGLYALTRQIVIQSFQGQSDSLPYTIEAMVMPDDTAWQPNRMPVIQSVSGNNKNYGNFDHCIGFQVERSNVRIKGLKLLGNANPGVEYYYAIERHRSELQDLDIEQCMFIGERNAARIQGAVFAQGSDIHVDHCIFYGCKNALLVFLGIRGFQVTHSIIYGAYEGAFWFGWKETADLSFVFSDNVVADCNYFFVGYPGLHPGYSFSRSLITGNTHYLGFNKGSIEPDLQNSPREAGVRKSGKVELREVTAEGVPRDYLHLTPASAGADIEAGIFHNTAAR
jgi:hypothetical protein